MWLNFAVRHGVVSDAAQSAFDDRGDLERDVQGVLVDPTAQDHRDLAAVLLAGIDHDVEQGPQPGVETVVTCEDLVEPVVDALDGVLEGGGVEHLLGGEVVVQRAPGQPCGVRQLAKGRAAETGPREGCDGGGQDEATCLLAVALAGSAHPAPRRLATRVPTGCPRRAGYRAGQGLPSVRSRGSHKPSTPHSRGCTEAERNPSRQRPTRSGVLGRRGATRDRDRIQQCRT
jgi:hypothetical protein